MIRFVGILLILQGLCLLGAGSVTGDPSWSPTTPSDAVSFTERTDRLMPIGCLIACGGALCLAPRRRSP